MANPREIYQQTILEHNKKPRNFGKIIGCTHQAEGHNPLCGDQLQLTLIIREGIIEDIQFEGHGCAIDVSNASLMTTVVKGKTVREVHNLIQGFRALVRGEWNPSIHGELGKLVIFQGVKDLPVRVKCAVLPWATLQSALDGSALASTE